MYSYLICEICKKRTRRLNGKKRFYMSQLPKDVDQCIKWLKVMGNEKLLNLPYKTLKYKSVCGDHFKPNDFNPLQSRLKKNVVPSVGLPYPPLSDDLLEKAYENILKEQAEYLKKKGPPVKNVQEPVKMIPLIELPKNCNIVGIYNPDVSTSNAPISASPTLVNENGTKMVPKADNKRKENDNLKYFYENFYSPEYKVFKDYELQFKEGRGICILLFDEFVLDECLTYNPCMDKIDGYVDFGDEGGRSEEIADHVLVFMLQNIGMDIKQSIAHYFFRGKLKPQVLCDLLKNVIRLIRKTGFTVFASVCNQSPINVEAINLLLAPDDKCTDINYYEIDDKKVYIVYDVPYLFKSLRNNLIRHGQLVIDTKTLNMSHLKMVEEKNRNLHFVKITKEHVDTVNWCKKGTKMAIEIFSNTVAGILKGLSESKANLEMSDEIFTAAEVIEELDNLFNCTYGVVCQRKKHPCIENVTSDSCHHSLWDEYKRKLKNTHFVNINGRVGLSDVRCIDGYSITLKSFQNIWNYIKENIINTLNLTCLNLYSLKDLFEYIEGEQQDNKHITCHQYELNIGYALLEPIKSFKTMKRRKRKCNLVMNEITLISEESDVTNDESDVDDDFNDDFMEPKSEKELDKLFERFEKHPNIYISAYLAVKLLKNIICEKCHETLELTEIEIDLYHNYTLLLEIWTEKCHPRYPSPKLCMTVEKAIKIFNIDIAPVLYIKNIRNYCVTTILGECDLSWMCEEHRNVMSRRLFHYLSCLLIRKQCRAQNQFITDMKKKSKSPRKWKQIRRSKC
ncbi:Transposable element P transposase [Papilio xuthus]|uniref:Transposable element P transposase n=1 Tax=Papilio xuthus TaxID=66420 RepID=A0A194Q1Z6_PAPXU|nr:Transposable element P transposase [Papilio xuthus]